MKINTFLGTLCILGLATNIDASPIPTNGNTLGIQASPQLQWKYGWKDGARDNTTGSAKSTNALPNANPWLSTGYGPAQLTHAYGFDQLPITNDGRGTTIAIIIAYSTPNIQSDLNTFCQHYNLPSTTVTTVRPPLLKASTNVDSGWAGEETLDVEWSHAMAPGAKIVLVSSPDASIKNLLSCVSYAVNTLHANVVSMSWGASEFSSETIYDTAFNSPTTAFVASSGDNGSGVSWPASSINVVGVGGTSLQLSVSEAITSETAWRGSGGGVSSYTPLPTYQNQTVKTSGRNVPDVSYVADPYTGVSVYFTDPVSTANGGWYVFGGTSVGAPQWSSILARKAGFSGSTSTQTFLTSLYQKAQVNYAAIIRDITSGSNGAFSAKLGYDNVTGLGSPVVVPIVEISGSTPTPSPTPNPTPTPSPNPKPLIGLKPTQLAAAYYLALAINDAFTYDRLAKNPSGFCFLTDGSTGLSYQQAQNEVAQGKSVALSFYINSPSSDPTILPVNIFAWQILKTLSYSPTALYIQRSAGISTLYQINLN